LAPRDWRPCQKHGYISPSVEVPAAAGPAYPQVPNGESDIELNPEHPVALTKSTLDNSPADHIVTLDGGQLAERRGPKKTTLIANVENISDFPSPECPQFSPAVGWNVIARPNIHGLCVLPAGYALAVVPNDAKIELLNQDGSYRPTNSGASKYPDEYRTSSSQLSPQHSFLKGFIAVFQLAASSYTLYQTKGDQISRFGYAAFGLTVAPYLVMSVVNLMAALLTPDYTRIYVAKTDVMMEAQRRHGIFEGIIGGLCPQDQTGAKQTFDGIFYQDDEGNLSFHPVNSNRDDVRRELGPPNDADDTYTCKWDTTPRNTIIRKRDDRRRIFIPSASRFRADNVGNKLLHTILLLCGSVFIGFLPIAIVGSFSHFQHGNSTKHQRRLVAFWLVFGIVMGPLCYIFPSIMARKFPRAYVLRRLVLAAAGVHSILGIIMVSEMIRRYGNCVKIY
jgi:hypothetical protein